MLVISAGLMLLAGLLFALTGNFVLLLIAATIGVISPSGGEVGPFLAIEQAALAQTVAGAKRTGVFAWYNLVGSFATALGALAGGAYGYFAANKAIEGGRNLLGTDPRAPVDRMPAAPAVAAPAPVVPAAAAVERRRPNRPGLRRPPTAASGADGAQGDGRAREEGSLTAMSRHRRHCRSAGRSCL